MNKKNSPFIPESERKVQSVTKARQATKVSLCINCLFIVQADDLQIIYQ